MPDNRVAIVLKSGLANNEEVVSALKEKLGQAEVILLEDDGTLLSVDSPEQFQTKPSPVEAKDAKDAEGNAKAVPAPTTRKKNRILVVHLADTSADDKRTAHPLQILYEPCCTCLFHLLLRLCRRDCLVLAWCMVSQNVTLKLILS